MRFVHLQMISNRTISCADKVFPTSNNIVLIMRKKRVEPVKLFETETTSVVVVYLMNRMFQNVPCLVTIFRIHHDPVLERLYLKIPLLLVTHLSPSDSDPNPNTQNPKTQLSSNPESKNPSN